MSYFVDWAAPLTNFQRRIGFYDVIQRPEQEEIRVELPVTMIQWEGFNGKNGRFWEPKDFVFGATTKTSPEVKKVDSWQRIHPNMRLFLAQDDADIDGVDTTLHAWSRWPV